MRDSDVDLILLTRDESLLLPAVREGIEAQAAVRLILHTVVGTVHPLDANRWDTIVRARNAGKRLGTAPWVMFLDDDVQLAPDAVDQLRRGLLENPIYGALAVDYLGESAVAAHTHHVAMGATLFRRDALERITFRWTAGRCECRCCCDDLRQQGIGIRYWPGARARHLKARGIAADQRSATPAAGARPGRILAAFDRRHFDKFRRQFLGSLRASGNEEKVTAVGYGLYPSERAVLASQPGVEVVALPLANNLPPIQRLQDFQTVLLDWPGETPVAYWDAGDVYFQGLLAGLWDVARTHPDKLLAVREPKGYPDNQAVAAWSLSIDDPEARVRAFNLLSTRPFLNSGFAGGTARTLLAYLREAHRLRNAAELRGTTDWGDQTALNLYCHARPERWLEVEEGWNYCVHDRPRGEIRVRPGGQVVSARGTPIHVVHGNAHSLRRLELYGL